MRTAIWVMLGWLGLSILTALATRLAPAGVFPDAAVVVVAFLALRREAIRVAVVAVLLGYLAGRQAAAPLGLHEVALLLSGLVACVVVGQLAVSGAAFFAFLCGLTVMAYHVVLFCLLWSVRGHSAFSSWATAVLLFNGLVTAGLGAVVHRPLVKLEARLFSEERKGLQWQ